MKPVGGVVLALAGFLLGDLRPGDGVQFPAAHATVYTPPAVGEATLVIGKARLVGSDGTSRLAHRGSELRAGDRVETDSGSHVHIRFVDGGLVSVRPGSRLVIEQYAASTVAIGASGRGAIKFRLEEGVVRSITGAWGESARERFRLNTPVAAIGVKGTDFVVRSTGEATAASVFAGAIIISPLTDACAATLGPCSTGTEKFLSADMKGQMVEFHRDQSAPRLVPSVDLLTLVRQRDARSARVMSVPERPVLAADVPLEVPLTKPTTPERLVDEVYTASTLAVVAARGEAPLPGSVPTPPSTPSAGALPPPVPTAPPSASVPTPAPAPAELSAAPSDPAQQLTWMHYRWVAKIVGDDFSKQFDAAMAQGTRWIATDGAYTLNRPSTTAFLPTATSASFRLTDGAANVVRDAGTKREPVQITRATLEVDFARSTFSTEITAAGPVLGTAVVQGAGGIDVTGVIRQASGNSHVVGGFNGNGERAGLLFRREVPGGVLQGVTLWGR